MAPQNQSITLSLNLNCSRAAKAYSDLQKSIMDGEAELAEMRKKVNGTSYADLFPDVEKALEKRLKSEKNLMKRFQGDYADLNAELVHIQTQSTARLKTLIADTQARMDSLNFQKQRKEWMQLAKIRGEFEREMKARQEKQAATQSRAQDRIMREIHMSEQEIATMKSLQLAYAETTDKEEKAMRSMDRINKAKANAVKYTQDLAKAQQDLANAQAAAAANPADPTLQANVTNSQNYVNQLLAHPKKMPSAMSQTNAQNRLALAQQNKAAAEAAYNQFMQQTGAGPIQGSIQKLKSLYQELEQLRNNTADKDKAQQISLELQRIKEHIDAMQTAPLRSLKEVLNDIANAKSLQQLEKYRTELTSILHNSTNSKEAARAKRELEDLEVRIKNYGKEYMKLRDIKKVVAQGDQADVKQQELAIKSLERLANMRGTNARKAKEYKDMIEQIRQTTKGLAYDEKFVGDQLKNLRSAPLKDLERAAQMVEQRMKTLKRNTDEYVRAQGDLAKIKKQLNDINGSLKTQGDWFMKAITKLGNYVGIFGTFYMIRNELQKAFEANIKYDDSLSDIRKTTQMTSEAVEQLADNIKKINSRTSLEDITNLAYAAGRLGVKGASDVMGFVRAADQINIALGEQLNGAESVEQLMKITNLMGINQEYGLEQALLKTGSAINVLTMESTATAQPMVDFMKRTAGIATQSGVTTAELTGLAGAVNALGQNVEMSATSISKVMVQISSNSKKVAQALKLTDEEATKFFNDIRTGHMMDAMLMVLEKTRDAGGLSHLGTIVKDLGSEGQRVIQTIATLSSNYDVVEKMVRRSTQAFEEGTSATEEYNLKNSNTAALWEKLKNNIAKRWVSTDNINFIHELLLNLQELPRAIDNLVASFSWLTSIFKGFVWMVTNATFALETFVQTIIIRAVAARIMMWSNSFAGFEFSLKRCVVGLKNFTLAWKSMNAAMKLNVITAIAAAVLAIYHALTDAARAAKEFENDLAKALQQAKTQAQAESNAIGQLTEKIKGLNENSVQRKDLITELNNKYGAYLENLIEEGASYQTIAEAMEAVNAQLKMKAILDAKVQSEADLRNDFVEERGEKKADLIESIMEGMKVEDRSTAANIANTLLNERESMFRKEYDKENMVYKYKQDSDGESTKRRVQILRQAFANVGITDLLLGDNYRDVISKLKEAANTEGKFEGRYERIQEVYNADAKNEAAEAQKYYVPATERQWADVSALVTQNGKLTPDFNEEGAEERIKGYATKDDEVWYADERDKMDIEGRKETIKQLDEYINMSRQLLDGLKLTDAEAAELEAVNLSNAEAARRIFALGMLENKPDKGGNGKNPGSDMYADIIARINNLYDARENDIRRFNSEGKTTPYEFDRDLDDNEIRRREMLRMVRLRISDKITKEEFDKAFAEMKADIIKNDPFGTANAYANVAAVGDPGQIGDYIRKTAKLDDEEGKKANKLISEIKDSAEKDRSKQLEIAKKQNDSLLKLLMENNPIGALDEKWQRRFEEMNLMYMKLGGNSPEERQKNERIAMSKMQELGSMTGNFDITNPDDLEGFYNQVVRLFPDFAKAYKDNKEAAMKQVESMYYETYQYNRDIDEAISKQVEKHTKLWEKMYKQSPAYKTGLDNIENLKEQYKYLNRMQNFGFSNRTALARNLVVKQSEEDLQTEIWQNNIRKAKAARDAAEADKKAGKDGAAARLKEAKEELAKIQEKPDAVRNAEQATKDAMNALLDATHAWISDMVKAFDTFMDGFVPFRSWYEDKGTKDNPFWRNVFGTKEERQKAFGQFMDDLKKTIREEYMQRTKAKMTEWIEAQKRKREEEKEKMLQEAQRQASADDELAFQEWLLSQKLDAQEDFQEQSLNSAAKYFEDFKALLKSFDDSLDETIASVRSGFDNWWNTSPELAALNGIATNKYEEVFVPGANMRTEADSLAATHGVNNERKGVIVHHTGDYGNNTEKSVINTFTNPDSVGKPSAHVMIGRDGKRYVFVPDDKIANHAGKSEWKGRDNVNDFELGVEFAGDTDKNDLTPEQLESFVEWIRPRAKMYGWTSEDVASHGMVAPGRKTDVNAKNYQLIMQKLQDEGVFDYKNAASGSDLYNPENIGKSYDWGNALIPSDSTATDNTSSGKATDVVIQADSVSVESDVSHAPNESNAPSDVDEHTPRNQGLIFQSAQNEDEHYEGYKPNLSGVDYQYKKTPSAADVSIGAASDSLKSGAAQMVGESTGSNLAAVAASSLVQAGIDKAKQKKELKEQNKEQKKALDEQTANISKAEKAQTTIKKENQAQQQATKKAAADASQSLTETVAATEIATDNTVTSTEETNTIEKTSTSMWGNLGRAVSEAWAQGGPYLGPVLAAGVSAAVGALMTMVFNMMGHKGKGAASTVNTKLVSGMLTYDAGNVQSFLVPAYDDGLMPVMADNGKVYMAHPAGQLGTGMVNRPTLTTIGGMPALVGEEGPEMVIGRETTRALQMNRPDIMRIIQAYDARHSRGYAKAYDNGNVGDVMGSAGAMNAGESTEQMQQTLIMLNNTLVALQQEGIKATINKYGRGGLVDEVTSGIEETRRVGSSNRVNRLFR